MQFAPLRLDGLVGGFPTEIVKKFSCVVVSLALMPPHAATHVPLPLLQGFMEGGYATTSSVLAALLAYLKKGTPKVAGSLDRFVTHARRLI
ncbi:MAG: hypothetical protein B7Z77_06820 [Acidocella sp. 20-58-15]|nr:MAG: hypothetical protein B7Z77_06820 [Acidocella sp. 20-58-15]